MPTKTRPDIHGPERRFTTLKDAVVDRGEDGIGFTGHAARFNSPTWIGPKRWGFEEKVAPGAFAKSIKESDVRFLINHDPNLILARNMAGTLRLSEDDDGLLTDADLARTSYGDDLGVSLERGDITQMSFAFETIKDEWEMDEDTGEESRTLLEVKLWDVSAVTYPAYDDTDAALRSVAFDVLAARMGLTDSKRDRLVAGLAHHDLDDDTRDLLRQASQRLARLLSDDHEPAPTTRDDTDTPDQPAPATGHLALMQRRHALLAMHYDLAG